MNKLVNVMYIIDRHFVKRQGRNRAYIKINGGIFSAGIKFEGVNTQFGYLKMLLLGLVISRTLGP